MRNFSCPSCKSKLEPSSDGLYCVSCREQFQVVQNIPILVEDFDQLESQLEELRSVKPNWYQESQQNEMTSPWRHHLLKRRKYVQKLIRELQIDHFASKPLTILDLGCGDGNTLHWLAPFAQTLLATDYSLLRIGRAQQQGLDVDFALSNIYQLPIADGSIDIVFFNHVLEHLQDEVAALREVKRILRNDGVLILGIPNEGSWWWQHAYKRDPASLANSDHVHFFTAQSVTSLLTSLGFGIDSVKHLGWGPPDWALDARLRKYKALDDLFSVLGQVLLPNQASSLYIQAHKT